MPDNNEPETLTITQAEYNQLRDDSEFLNCLRCAGVDNWEGYGVAQEMMEED